MHDHMRQIPKHLLFLRELVHPGLPTGGSRSRTTLLALSDSCRMVAAKCSAFSWLMVGKRRSTCPFLLLITYLTTQSKPAV